MANKFGLFAISFGSFVDILIQHQQQRSKIDNVALRAESEFPIGECSDFLRNRGFL
jgi:hypothetical protein